MSARLKELLEELFLEIDRKVEAAVDERMSALTPRLITEATAPRDEPGEYGDALAVARIMGLDVETEEQKKSARNKVYYLVEIGSLPTTRLSKKRMRFDLSAVRRILTQGREQQSAQ